MLDKISIFRTTPRIVMGSGAINGLGREVKDLKAARALIVTDPGIINAGILRPVEVSLKEARIKTMVFSDVSPDPRHQTVDDCLTAVRDFKPSCVIGLGGGAVPSTSRRPWLSCSEIQEILSIIAVLIWCPNRGFPPL